MVLQTLKQIESQLLEYSWTKQNKIKKNQTNLMIIYSWNRNQT